MAKSLLTNYTKDFRRKLNQLETAAFLAGQVMETVAERSAAREIIQRLVDDLLPGRDDEADLLDREAQLELFRWRASTSWRASRGVCAGALARRTPTPSRSSTSARITPRPRPARTSI